MSQKITTRLYFSASKAQSFMTNYQSMSDLMEITKAQVRHDDPRYVAIWVSVDARYAGLLFDLGRYTQADSENPKFITK